MWGGWGWTECGDDDEGGWEVRLELAPGFLSNHCFVHKPLFVQTWRRCAERRRGRRGSKEPLGLGRAAKGAGSGGTDTTTAEWRRTTSPERGRRSRRTKRWRGGRCCTERRRRLAKGGGSGGGPEAAEAGGLYRGRGRAGGGVGAQAKGGLCLVYVCVCACAARVSCDGCGKVTAAGAPKAGVAAGVPNGAPNSDMWRTCVWVWTPRARAPLRSPWGKCEKKTTRSRP